MTILTIVPYLDVVHLILSGQRTSISLEIVNSVRYHVSERWQHRIEGGSWYTESR